MEVQQLHPNTRPRSSSCQSGRPSRSARPTASCSRATRSAGSRADQGCVSCAHAIVVAWSAAVVIYARVCDERGQNLMTGGPGPHGLSDEDAGVRRWRPGGPARAASGGRAEPGPPTCGSSLSAGRRHTAARDARTASPGCGWRPPRPTPASRSGAWTPAQTGTCSTAPCLRSASPGLSAGYARRPRVTVDPVPRNCTRPARPCRARVIPHRIRRPRRRAAWRARPEQARSTRFTSLSPTS